MSPEEFKSVGKNELIIRRESGLTLLPNGESSALAEIISRSLVHIKTNKDLALPERRAGDECEFEIALGVNIVMCWIPLGEFIMGSARDEIGRDEDETQHRVIITKGFWLAKIPTTNAQWYSVMGFSMSPFRKKANQPVSGVSWNDVCGDELGSGPNFLNSVNLRVAPGDRFVLPTEAQWEYACRAGTTGPFEGNLGEVAWYSDNMHDKSSSIVGIKRPNAWGLYDMLGCVAEWCSDWYGEHRNDPAMDPVGPNSGSERVMRGGGYERGPDFCRFAKRMKVSPDFSYNSIGFRLALVPAS